MATYALAAGERAAHAKTLVASTVDTITFTDDVDAVEVVSDGVAAIYVRVDGSAPTVAGAFSYVMPAGVQSVRTIPMPGRDAGSSVVKLISAGVPTYSVTRVP